MEITIKCEKCGNEAVIKSITKGNIAYFAQGLHDKDFSLNDIEIDVELQNEEVNDEVDVETELKEIRIDCTKCGEYIVLEF